jgi:molybdopterin synthase sulfur carrier subunit
LDLSVIISNNFYNRTIFYKVSEIMVKIEFLGPISREPLEIEANSLEDIAKALQEINEISGWLDKCAVAINDNMTNDLSTKLKSGDRVSILPPVCGG